MGILEFTEVKYPNMREELIDYLDELSSIDYQKDVWLNHVPREGVVYSVMSYAIHFIFDDTCLAKDPVAAVGLFLKNMEEVDVINALVKSLDNLFDIYGANLSDEDYLITPEWKDVVDCAKAARKIIF